MSEKDLLMLGTVPLEAPEEVFQICGRTIGNSPALFSAEDKAGRRTISIPAMLDTDLKRWKLQCPQSEEGLVFSTLEGKPHLPRLAASRRVLPRPFEGSTKARDVPYSSS
jgi:hypothetical protein